METPPINFSLSGNRTGHVREVNRTGHVREVNRTGHVREVNRTGHVREVNRTGHVREVNRTGHVREVNRTGHVREVNRTSTRKVLSMAAPIYLVEIVKIHYIKCHELATTTYLRCVSTICHVTIFYGEHNIFYPCC